MYYLFDEGFQKETLFSNFVLLNSVLSIFTHAYCLLAFTYILMSMNSGNFSKFHILLCCIYFISIPLSPTLPVSSSET